MNNGAMNAALAATAVLAALCGLLTGASALRRRGVLGAEAARKSVHAGMGLVGLTFPWLFADSRPVVVLAALAIGVLLAIRHVPALRARAGRALYDVGRPSYGEIAYVAGVATAFVLAAGSVIAYIIPVLVLTFADPAASLVGMRCARHRFVTRDGTKSIGGSLAFFFTALICTSLTLVLAGRTDALGAGLAVSGVLTLIEASASAGLDNFTILLAGGICMQLLDVKSLPRSSEGDAVRRFFDRAAIMRSFDGDAFIRSFDRATPLGWTRSFGCVVSDPIR